MPSSFRGKWLEHPRATPVLLAVVFLFTLPTLAVGFFADDFALRDSLLGRGPAVAPWFDLYWFTPGTRDANLVAQHGGMFPWWSSPDLKLHLFRPLASVLLALDERLFGDAPLGWHLHSIAWYLALVVAVAGLYRRVLPRATGTVALFFFAMCESHVHPYGWPSSRHATIAALFGVLALIAYVRACDDSWAPGPWLAGLALAVGLAAGETAIELLPFGAAFALLGPRKEGVAPHTRMRAALPSLAVVVAYCVVYRARSCGIAHSGGYYDPITSPLAFARAAVLRYPLLLGNATLSVPAELGVAFPIGPLAVIGLAGAIGVALLYRASLPAIPPEERAALAWLVPGAALAIVPGLGGFPGARLLLVPNVGFAALFGVLLPRAFGRIDGQAALARVFRRSWGGFLTLVHAGFAPLLMIVSALSGAQMGRACEAVAFGADLGGAARPRVFVVAASDPMVGIYPPALLLSRTPDAASCWANLSAAKGAHVLERTGASTIALEVVGTTMMRSSFERLYRPDDEPLRAGDEAESCGAKVRVAALRDGLPTRIEVDFGAPLENPSLRLLEWKDGKLQRLAPPPVGGRVDLPWSAGPMKMF